jgi:heme/copper-type cytochrome/quinol oxidase subunit 1
MTMTDTRPEAPLAADSAFAGTAPGPGPREPTGLHDWLTTGDHTKIGRLYIVGSLLALLGVLVIGALLGFERVDDSASQVIPAHVVTQLYSLYGVGLIFCVVVPFLFGLATAIVPLQVGARAIAFPRAAALSFWAWLAGSGVMIGSYAANGGPGGGKPGATSLFLASLVVVVAALLLDAVCVVTTVLTLRARGMWLDWVPFFAWSVLVSGVMLLVTLPVLVGELIYLYVDFRYGQPAFGGSQSIPVYTSWVFTEPQVYAFAVPALGLIADMIAVFARRRLQQGDGVLIAIGLAGALGFGAWAQPAFFGDVTNQFLYKAMVIGAVIPVLMVLGAAGLTMRTGRPRFGAPLVYAVVAGLLALGAALLGVLLPISGLGLEGTVYALGHTNAVLYAAIVGGLGGLAYWGPKLWGRSLPQVPVAGLGGLALLGVVLIVTPDVILGFLGQPAGTVTNFGIDGPVAFLNGLSAAGYCVLALAVLGLMLIALRGFLRGPVAGDDPWEGQTLEWATASPPPRGNFVESPVVRSPQPLFDARAVGEEA